MKNVAILIPTYNSEPYIAETLESLRAQGIEPAEMPLVYLADDGSRDDTINLVRSQSRDLFPIRFSEPTHNRGQWGNVNDAMMDLKGWGVDWVLILHSDDVARSRWLATFLSRIEQADERVGSICSSWDDLYPGGKIVPGEDKPERPIERISGDLEAVRGTLFSGCWWHISGCAIRMQAF